MIVTLVGSPDVTFPFRFLFFARERGFIQVELIHLDLQTQSRMELAAKPFLEQELSACALGFEQGQDVC